MTSKHHIKNITFSLALPPCPEYGTPTFVSGLKLTSDLISSSGIGLYVSGFSGRFWLRISGAIYNTREDYFALRDALKKMFKK